MLLWASRGLVGISRVYALLAQLVVLLFVRPDVTASLISIPRELFCALKS